MVNIFINDLLTINTNSYCDIDFVVSGLLRYSSFYAGNMKEKIRFVKTCNLKQKLSKALPSLYFLYANLFKKKSEGYRIHYSYI